MARRAATSASIGTVLEWFDFSLYGALAATVFPAVFFPDLSPAAGILASFATFGAGFIARPLGALVFGYLGDRYGRRDVLMLTLVAMGAASALIGLLPGYATIGLLAPTVLVLMRFVRGLAAGGEVTGAQLIALEHAPPDRRGRYGSFVAIASPISQVLATLTLTGLAAGLSDEAFSTWGWRVPLLASVLLIVAGVFIRRYVSESLEFTAAQEQAGASEQPKALAVFRKRPGTVVKLALTWAAPGCLYYVTSVLALSYMTNTAGFRRDVTFGILVVAHLVSIFFGLAGGRVADRLGRRTAMLIGLGALSASSVPLFPAIDGGNVVLVGVLTAGALSAVLFMQAGQSALFAEAFPARMRYTGASAAYTGANVVFSATAPFVASGLLALFGGNPLAVTGYGLVLVAVSASALLFLPNRTVAPSATEAL